MQKLAEIANTLEAKYDEDQEIGAMVGITGAALFFFYYAKLTKNNYYAEKGTEVLATIIERINNGFLYPSFCMGLAGVGWGFDLVQSEDFVELDNDELLGSFDMYLKANMEKDLKEKEYDYMHGPMGQAMYFLGRYACTQNEAMKLVYEENLKLFMDSLYEMAEKNDDKLSWPSLLSSETGDRGYSFGMAHGVPSIISFMALLAEHEVFRDKAIMIMKGALNFLQSYKKDKLSVSWYPATVRLTGGADVINSRLAWCYGDLGVGKALLDAAEVLQDESLKEEALEVLLETTARRDLGECRIHDASNCHGAFGVCQIYHNLHQLTNEPAFAESAKYWMEVGLNMDSHEGGNAGYKQYRAGDGWSNEIGLLEGISGIGLVLISQLAEFDTQWETALLIK